MSDVSGEEPLRMEAEETATLAELEPESWYLSVLILVLFVLSVMKN